MQLMQYALYFIRYGKSQVCRVFQKREAFVGYIEKQCCRSQYRAGFDDIDIKDICKSEICKDKYLFASLLFTVRLHCILNNQLS